MTNKDKARLEVEPYGSTLLVRVDGGKHGLFGPDYSGDQHWVWPDAHPKNILVNEADYPHSLTLESHTSEISVLYS